MTTRTRTLTAPLAATSAALLTAGLLAGSVTPAAAHTGAEKHDMAQYARTWAKDQVLRPGCRSYTYRYKVSPPSDQAWGLETFLVGPGGDSVSSGALHSGSDRRKGRDTFEFCSTSTRPGKFKIRAKLTYYVGFTAHDGWADRTRFRLRRR
jgi:hypothetical protein